MAPGKKNEDKGTTGAVGRIKASGGLYIKVNVLIRVMCVAKLPLRPEYTRSRQKSGVNSVGG